MAEQPRVEVETYSPTMFIVTLRGDHDVSTRHEMTRVLNLASAYRYILVDLGECTFLDSRALGTLLQGAELASERAGALELVVAARPGNPVRRMMEIAGVEALLVMHPTRAMGIANLASLEQPRAQHRTTNMLGATVENIDDEASFGSDQRVTHGACESTGAQTDEGGAETERT